MQGQEKFVFFLFTLRGKLISHDHMIFHNIIWNTMGKIYQKKKLIIHKIQRKIAETKLLSKTNNKALELCTQVDSLAYSRFHRVQYHTYMQPFPPKVGNPNWVRIIILFNLLSLTNKLLFCGLTMYFPLVPNQ